jgi:NAD-dependent DNA ligase
LVGTSPESKLKRAEALGITIIDEGTFIEMLG